MSRNRIESAYNARVSAAALARDRHHEPHRANPDEQRYAAAHYPMSFTKGLYHEGTLGVVDDKRHFEAFRNAIDEGWIESFTSRVPVHTDPDCPRRQWEAPTAGIAYDLQGPDAQAVTMPPAPELCSDELAFEMAEVYELALLRDVPIMSFDQDGGPQDAAIDASLARLNGYAYAQAGFPNRPRKTDTTGQIDRQTAFRGSAPGVEVGPYVSQFLWIGNGDPTLGQIAYGAQRIDQTVPKAEPGIDYMQLWDDWLRVQQGIDVNTCGLGFNNDEPCGPGQQLDPTHRRFIYAPRDLATYVHFDALYQAYLNACLILLGQGTPFDPGFAKLSGMRDMFNPVDTSMLRQNAGGFALYGGPHILSLVTEVATRALKAVRFQKFNNHLRLRPEALAARIYRAQELDDTYPVLCGAFTKLRKSIEPTVEEIETFNDNAVNVASALLPMAFAEGSPMHPSYGAGHATVAGACVTILKAYFDTGAVLGQNAAEGCRQGQVGFFHEITRAVQYEVRDEGKSLDAVQIKCPLTLEGELNKLAANISIGRNMAGVHYFSDYYDSLRMGEEIAIGMLEEQALCYPTDEFVVTVPTFDGKTVRIGRK